MGEAAIGQAVMGEAAMGEAVMGERDHPRPEPSALTIQFLTWVARQPRTYDDTMEAWRTSCPRMPIWEDAVSDGLVALNSGTAMRDRVVALTPRGYAMLNGYRAALDGFVLKGSPLRMGMGPDNAHRTVRVARRALKN